MAVTQRSGESLRDYLTRFNNESTSIPNLQQEIAVVALMRGMNHCEFKKYLGRKSFTDLGSALVKAHEYIKSDELMTIPNHYQSAPTRNVAHRPAQPAQQQQSIGDSGKMIRGETSEGEITRNSQPTPTPLSMNTPH